MTFEHLSKIYDKYFMTKEQTAEKILTNEFLIPITICL
jgi:hypothetical protein